MTVARQTNFSLAGPWFAGLFGLALVAFWPSYLSQALSAHSGYTHLHAATAATWMLLLITQPLAIRRRHLAWHRCAGRLSYGLAPLVVASMLLLAHNNLKGLTGKAYAAQTYFLYLQLSLAAVFALCYALAIYHRRTTPLHARFMVCTALTLIDPVVIRLMFWAFPRPSWNYQWLTFGLTDLVLLALIWRDWPNPAGRRVFLAMLALFMAAQAPALLKWTQEPAWQAFAQWFAALGLT